MNKKLYISCDVYLVRFFFFTFYVHLYIYIIYTVTSATNLKQVQQV